MAQALFGGQRMEKQELSSHINTSAHLGWEDYIDASSRNGGWETQAHKEEEYSYPFLEWVETSWNSSATTFFLLWSGVSSHGDW